MPAKSSATTKPKKSVTEVKKKSAKSKPPPPPPSDSESESESESESGSEESSSEDEEQPRKTSGVLKSAAAAVQSTFRPPEPFFSIPAVELPDSSPFSAKNLAGKELWLITVPALTPLSKLSVVNPADVAEGNAVLESQKSGRSYCMKPEEDAAMTGSIGVDLLVADSHGQYTIAQQPISKAFKIVEMLPTPPIIPNDRKLIAKPVREQPKGLRMRFTALGADIEPVESNEPMDGDAMEVDGGHTKSSFALKEGAERKKRRRSGESEKKKKKKSRHDAIEE